MRSFGGAELGLDAPALDADLREREFGEGEGMLVADYLETYGECPEWHAAWGEAALMNGSYDDAVRSLETACAQSESNGAYAALLARAKSAGDAAHL